MDRSRIPGFYKLGQAERLAALAQRGFLNNEDLRSMQARRHELGAGVAEHMIENVIGVFSLPLGVGLNFLINDQDYVVPMVVEEPSIVAALSASAKILQAAGGITSEAARPLVYGQVQVVDFPDGAKAKATLLQHQEEILRLANFAHPRMTARGGGAKSFAVVLYDASDEAPAMLIAQLLIDTRDAMGANLVNSICEAVAPRIAELVGGRALLRILSNLTDASLVTARCRVAPRLLATATHPGEDIRDNIILANHFARIDPHRAATHNKGIMNGIDAVAIATGNDWRAIEAAAHAYAGRGQGYTALTRWSRDTDGNLCGSLEMPLQVGIVGGSSQTNPSVGINLRMLGVESAAELGSVMGAVGLTQNLAALRALVTDGIQRGHMALHARSVVASTGASGTVLNAAVQELIQGGDIKAWRAEEIVARMTAVSRDQRPRTSGLGNINNASPIARGPLPEAVDMPGTGVGHGKIILLGEHAAVYGSHALAAPLPMAIVARVTEDSDNGIHLRCKEWDIDDHWGPSEPPPSGAAELIDLVLRRLKLAPQSLALDVQAGLPRGMGLGGSAAFAVACIRALSSCFRLGLDNETVNAHAFACEERAHQTPSGVDNTVATWGRVVLYRRGTPAFMRDLTLKRPVTLVIGQCGIPSSTAEMVDTVRRARARNPTAYDRIFEQIDALTIEAATVLENGRLEELGELMNLCHGLLNALQVSRVELEELVGIARQNGALGAKLTGSGGGGSIVALCPDSAEHVARAMQRSGYRAFVTTLE